jgi:stringent starvation protein B
MTSAKPYLLRAIYEWLQDNNQTIYIAVDTSFPNVVVPQEYIRDNNIVLDISPMAMKNLLIGNEILEGKARFGEASRELYIPIPAINAIYSHETQQGMAFPAEKKSADLLNMENQPTIEIKKSSQKPKLTLVPGGLKDEKHPA